MKTMTISRSSNSDRRALIIKTVSEALQQQRETASDIDSIVRQTQITAMEIRIVFGNVHGLVIAMMEQVVGSLIDCLKTVDTKEELSNTLFSFAVSLTAAYCSSHLVGLYRIALTEATRHVGIRQDFYDKGPALLTCRLAEFLEDAGQKRLISRGNYSLLADQFIALLRGTLEHSGSAMNREAASNTVALFCNGILPETTDVIEPVN